MCQTKAQGGKRCSAHMAGSMATVSLTSIIAAVQEKIVRRVFGELKKEGKGLENPKQEEVVSYAETGKFLAKYNPDIPERQKKTIMKQFDKAKEEKPTGAVFHAWNHTLPEVLRRSRKTLTATGLAGALMFSSACSGGAGINSETTPAPTPETTISAPASPTASPSPAATNDDNANVIDGVPVKEGMVSDGKGEYRQTTITDDDPAMKYDPAKATEFAKTNFTPEDIEAGQKTAVKFLAEEGIDSTANGGGTAEFNAWWAKNEGRFHPSQKDSIYNSYISAPEKANVVLTSPWRQGKYEYDYSTGTRIKDRNITVTGIDGGTAPGGQPYLIVQTQVSFKSPVIANGGPAAEKVTGTANYSMLKDADGTWKIAGFNAEYNATETAR